MDEGRGIQRLSLRGDVAGPGPDFSLHRRPLVMTNIAIENGDL